jgi:hypothetical protein
VYYQTGGDETYRKQFGDTKSIYPGENKLGLISISESTIYPQQHPNGGNKNLYFYLIGIDDGGPQNGGIVRCNYNGYISA